MKNRGDGIDVVQKTLKRLQVDGATLARLLGVTKDRVSHWRTGRREVPDEALKLMQTLRPADALVPAGYQPLTSKRGVFRKGQRKYRLTPGGTRWARAPQGSAEALRSLPVGHILRRAWDGAAYEIRKEKNTIPDGGWVMVNVDGDPTPRIAGLHCLTPAAWAKLITGGNAWSGAKFWGVRP